MERRLLLALALSFLVIMLTRPYWEPQRPPVSAPVGKTAEQKQVSSQVKTASSLPGGLERISNDLKKGASEKRISVETNLYHLTLSNKEAVVLSWMLKRYTDNNGKLLDVVDGRKAQVFGYPLALQIDKEEEASKALKNIIFVVSSPDRIDLTGSTSGSQTVTFEYADETLRVEKKLTFFPGSYVVNVDCQVWVQGRPASYFLGWYSGFGDTTVDAKMAVRRAVYRTDGKVKRIKEGDIGAGLEFSGSFDLAGLEDTYFAALFLPPSNDMLHRIHFAADENVLAEGKRRETPERIRFCKSGRAPRGSAVCWPEGHRNPEEDRSILNRSY